MKEIKILNTSIVSSKITKNFELDMDGKLITVSKYWCDDEVSGYDSEIYYFDDEGIDITDTYVDYIGENNQEIFDDFVMELK